MTRVGARKLLLGTKPSSLWTPALPTSDGGVLPHTWHYAGSGALYQDAAKIIPAVADGDVVGASENQGSDVHDITQAVTADKPTLRLNVLNGHPVFRFDGTDDLKGTFGGGAIAQPNTILAMAQLSVAGAGDANTYNLCDSMTTGRAALYKQTATWRIYATAVLTGGLADANWNAWLTLFNGVGSQFWHNGVSEAVGAAGASAMGGLTLGASDAQTNEWDGDIAELLIYASNLSTADQNQVGQYLATKFGTVWTDIP